LITFANCFGKHLQKQTKHEFMLNRHITKGILVFSAFLLLFASCSQYQKLLKSDDVMLKKERRPLSITTMKITTGHWDY
jgi:uncharacterized lipoprotein YajG